MGSDKLDALKSMNFYEVLNVPPDASVEQIKESYKEIARIYHPDSNFYSDIISIPLSAEEQEIFKLITSAYNTLINNEKRAAYDELIPKGLRGWEEEAPQESSRPQTKVYETRIPTPEVNDLSAQMERLRALQTANLNAKPQEITPQTSPRVKAPRSTERQVTITLLIGGATGLVVGAIAFALL